MIYFLKHFKGIAYFLVMLILFQSCVIYKSKPSTVEQASLRKNTHIKIFTKGGYKHKLRWIEEKHGNVFSITNTKRVFLKKSKLSVNQYKYKLMDIEDKGDYIKGIKLTGKDTTTIVIPVDEIEVIKITSRGASIPINIIGWGLLSIAGGYGLIMGLWYWSDSSI